MTPNVATSTRLLVVVGLTLSLIAIPQARAVDIDLPVLGDAASGIISRQQEYELGRVWLKAFRARVKEYDDPLMQQYLEQLIYNLATHSDLEDPRLEVVIVKNPTMNAFAVPGGVIGFHTGVFIFAENEDQMASVLAHELAHLSQRHFARGVEAQRKNSLIAMGGMLAGLVLAATVGGDAGTAAMATSQAAAIENQLRYSRSNEQEADRVGLQTMERAGRDPGAAAGMFESLLKATRYTGSRPPEFLLTHPITEKRIADARSRSMSQPMRHYPDNPVYYLMRSRAILAMENNPQAAINRFSRELEGTRISADAAHYGLALAYIENGDIAAARDELRDLIAGSPEQLVYRHADIEADIAAREYDAALTKLQRLLATYPGNYPLLVLQSEALWQAQHYEEAADVLKELARHRPEDPMIWYRLAEVRGLAGDISGVHLARAEYFILIGVFDKAREQLGLALKLVEQDFKQSAIIQQRLRDVAAMEERMQKL